jgi:hypothetical protein
MPKRVVGAGLLILVCALSSGCALGERPTQPDPQSLQLRGVEIGVSGTLGPRHGPYGR